MPSIIVEMHLLNPRHVEIGLAHRIQSGKGQGEDMILTGSLVDRRMPDRGCRYAQRHIPASEPSHNQLGLSSRDIEIRDHRLGVGRGRIVSDRRRIV
jgi:hypothetical protein